MGLTRPRISNIDTTLEYTVDPIVTLNTKSTLANTDIGFVFNRDAGISSNTALYWSETLKGFVHSYTSSGGLVPGNVTVTSYANIYAGSYYGNLAGGTTGATYITGNLIPTANAVYNLGGPGQWFRSLYLSGNTIYLGGQTISATATGFSFTTQGGGRFDYDDSQGGFTNFQSATGVSSVQTSFSNVTVSGFINVSGNILGSAATFNSITASTLNVAGGGLNGVAIGQTTAAAGTFTQLNAGQINTTGNILSTGAIHNSLTVNGNETVTGYLNVTGNILAQNIVGTLVNASQTNITSVGNLSSLSVAGAGTFYSAPVVTATTNATALGTGALIVQGGGSFAKDLYVGGNIYAANVLGINYNYLTVQDPLVYLSSNTVYPYNYSIGFYSHFIGGPANAYAHTGLVRSWTNNSWYLFSNVAEPVAGNVNVSDANLIYDNLYAGSINSIGYINTTGNILSTGAIHNSLTVNGNESVTGYLNVTGNVLTASLSAGQLNTTGNLLATSGTFNAVTVNGYLNNNGNISTAQLNAGQINTTGNVLTASLSAGQINTTGNVLATAGTFNALTVNGNESVTGYLNVTGNVLTASLSAGQINATGNVLATAGVFNALTVNGNTTSTGGTFVGELFVTTRGGQEGGQINMAPSVTNNTLSGNIVIDIYDNKVRIFESAGTNRGGYFDLTGLSAGVGTNLAAGGGGGTPSGGAFSVQFNSGSSTFAGAASLFYIGANGAVVSNAGIASTSTTTGSFQISGGIGVTGAVVAGQLNTTGNILSTGAVHNALTVNGTATATTFSGSGASLTSIPNGALVNSSVTVTAGTGMSGGGAVSLGSSITLTNAGVTSAVAGTDITVSGATGAVTIGTNSTLATVTGRGATTSSGITLSGGGTALNLSNGTSNRITWGTAGVAAPTFTSYSAGVKAVLYDNVGAASTGYTIGINASTMFFTTDTTGSGYAWYGGTTQTMTLSGAGVLSATGGFSGTATSAKYADLAEKYVGDENYVPGTVVVFGGEKEVTISTQSHDPAIAGVVSTDPGFLMNKDCDEGISIALQGRVPCRVLGPIRKGDRVVASQHPGVAQKLNKNLYEPGCIIGKALENIEDNSIQTIEVVVGRV